MLSLRKFSAKQKKRLMKLSLMLNRKRKFGAKQTTKRKFRT